METDDWYFNPDLTAARLEMLKAHADLNATARGSHAYARRLDLAERADRAYLQLFTASLLADGAHSGRNPRLALVSAQRSTFDRR